MHLHEIIDENKFYDLDFSGGICSRSVVPVVKITFLFPFYDFFSSQCIKSLAYLDNIYLWYK